MTPRCCSIAPETFKSAKPRWREFESLRYTLQVAPEDCTGCRLCVEVCPAKSKSEVKHKAINMQEQTPLRQPESLNWEFFLSLPELDRHKLSHSQVKDCAASRAALRIFRRLRGLRRNAVHQTAHATLRRPPAGRQRHRLLLNLWRQLADHALYAMNKEGRGPTWSNSLFEDNAEFGLGMRLAVDQQAHYARELVSRLSGQLGDELVNGLLEADQSKETGIEEQRRRVIELKQEDCRPQFARGACPAAHRRYARSQERLAGRRRRLGL